MDDVRAADEAAAVEAQASLARSMIPDVRRLAPQLILAGLLPVIGYAVLRPHVSSDATALAAVMVFPLIDIVVARVRHGADDAERDADQGDETDRFEGAVALNGNDMLLKLRESVFTGAFGVVCLVTLFAPRPAMFYVGRAFATAGNPEAKPEFELIWHRPGAARRFRMVTAVWGIGLVGEAVLRTVLALTISTERFLAIAPVLGWIVIGALIWYSTLATRAGEREARLAAEAIAPAD